jgi:hypothetical protein
MTKSQITNVNKSLLHLQNYFQSCGSGSRLDPDSMTCVFIRIRNPDPWARKMKKKCTFPLLFKHFQR